MENKINLNSNENINLTYPPESEKYYLIKNDVVHKIKIFVYKDEIFIKSKNYLNKLNQNDSSKLFETNFRSIYDAYNYINNLFEDNMILIADIIKNKEIKLIFRTKENRDIELSLLYNIHKVDFKLMIAKEFEQLKEKINELTNLNDKLNKEINQLKNQNEHNQAVNFEFLSDIIDDAFSYVNLDNTFLIFKSMYDKYYLIYTNTTFSIIIYDLNNNQKIIEIKNAHKVYITNFRHHFDKIGKRVLIMSVSRNDNNIKIWNIFHSECLVDIKNINGVGFIYSSCFLTKNNDNFIITSNRNLAGNPEAMKIFNIKGEKMKEINDSFDQTFFVGTYYDNILNKEYIISGNFGYVKSFDYNENSLYHKYDDNKCENDNKFHCSVIVQKIDKIVKIFESSGDGFIRIWNFHSGELLNKIKIGVRLYSICLWNENFLLVGCEDNTIKLIDLNYKLVIQNLAGHKNWVLTLQKLFLPIYGECFISQNWGESSLKIWKIKK